MHAGVVTRLGLQTELRTAMDREQFEMHYQPIVDLDNEGTDHFEALVRWRHPELGLVPPLDFLPAMEETGLMVKLERWIVDEVCRQIAEWQLTYDGVVNVSVNVSHRLFWDTSLLPHILDCLRRHGLTPANLTLEITAGVIVRNPDVARVRHRGAPRGRDRHADRQLRHGHVVAARVAPLPDPRVEDRPLVHPRARRRSANDRARAGHHRAWVGRSASTSSPRASRPRPSWKLLREMGCRTAQGFWFTEAVDGDAAAQFLGHALPVRDRSAVEPASRPRVD